MKRAFVLLVILAVVGVSQASIVNGDSVTVDFSNAADAGDFIVIRDDTPSTADLGVGQIATGGVGGTGGLEAVNVGGTNGSNDLAALYAPGGSAVAGSIAFGINETLTESIKFKTLHTDEAATPRLGIASFVDVATATTTTTAWDTFDINGGKDIIGGTTSGNYAGGIAVNLATGGDKTFNIANTIGGGARTLIPDPAGTYVLTDETWYQFVLEITKLATADQFDVNVTLNLLTADGTAIDSELASFGQTITNAGLYADSDVISGFTIVHDGEPDSVTNEYDDFSVAVTPEPATMVLLGLGSLVMVRRRK